MTMAARRRPMSREFASSADVVDVGASSTRYEAPRLVRRTVVDFGWLGLPADVRRALAEAFWCHFGVMAERCIPMRWHYIKVFDVLKNLGLLSEKPVRTARGQEVVPLEVVKAVLPDPASLAPDYTGKTCIGDLVRGTRNGQAREVLLYNVCDHEACYREVGSQAISYTAGVPVVAAAMLIANGTWDIGEMANVEELDPLPFIQLMNGMGLPTRIRDAEGDRLPDPAREVGFSRERMQTANAR